MKNTVLKMIVRIKISRKHKPINRSRRMIFSTHIQHAFYKLFHGKTLITLAHTGKHWVLHLQILFKKIMAKKVHNKAHPRASEVHKTATGTSATSTFHEKIHSRSTCP